MTNLLQRRLETLYGLERRKDKLGLEGTRSLLAALGDPHTRFRSVHVAGTNGKGSVCALVERVLREAGHRTGLYTSPHLVEFRERIRVNGRWADEDWLESALDRIESVPGGQDRTFFEVATALGFLYFAERGVEIAVVEVGLGGRLDCTNVLTPEVAVITSIGLDHTEILGDTLERIAAEKAGILKAGVPWVSGVAGGPASSVIEAIAAERGAPRHHGTVPSRGVDGLEPSLAMNERVALATLSALIDRRVTVPDGAIDRGFARARWPGRLERCPSVPRLWWDGAHNPSAAATLTRARMGGEAPGAIVLAFSRDKDVDGFLVALAPEFAGAVIVAARTRNERAATPAAIVERARARGFDAVEAADVPSAVREALRLAGRAPVLLTGSLFAVGEAMEAFGGAPGEQL